MGGQPTQLDTRLQPNFFTPGDVGPIRQDLGKFISQGLNAFFGAGSNILGTPQDPLQQAASSSFQGLLTGSGGGPFASANRTLQEQIETGLPIDTSPIVDQARGIFSQVIAPEINEQVSSRFGIKAGGAPTGPLAQAGERFSQGVSAQLLPFANAAANRRAAGVSQAQALAQGGGQLGIANRGMEQQDISQLFNNIFRFSDLLVGQGQSGFETGATSQFQKAGSQQNFENMASVASIIFGGGGGGKGGGGSGGGNLGFNLGGNRVGM